MQAPFLVVKDNGEKMLPCYSSYLLTDNLENPEYAVSTLSQERRAIILCLQTIHPSLFIHTTSPAKRRLENSAVRFEREIQFKRRRLEGLQLLILFKTSKLADFENGSLYEPRSGVPRKH